MKLFAAPPCLFLGCSLCLGAESPLLADPAASTNAGPAPQRRSDISAGLAAKLAERMPKYAPNAPRAPDASPSSNAQETPANGIIRLPRYQVQERRLPYFSERDLLTNKGRLDLALKTHPGFNFGPLKFLNHRRAREWYAEDQQAARNAEMAELLGAQAGFEQLRKPRPPRKAELTAPPK